jgi:hypothetical protein
MCEKRWERRPGIFTSTRIRGVKVDRILVTRLGMGVLQGVEIVTNAWDCEKEAVGRRLWAERNEMDGADR